MGLIPARRSAAKVFACAVVVLLLCSAAPTLQRTQAAANPLARTNWLVAASHDYVIDGEWGSGLYDAIYMIQPETGAVHGPFLMDVLTSFDEETVGPSGGDLYDVAVTPDSRTAILTSYNKRLVHFVDISQPLEPVYLSSLQIGYSAGDIAITPDGRFALVTDGSFSRSVECINIATRTLAYSLILPEVGKDGAGYPIFGGAQAVAAAPNGTVIIADVSNGAIYTLLIDSRGVLTYTGIHQYFIASDGTTSLTQGSGFQSITPVNIAIAPDGQTVLVSDITMYADTGTSSYSDLYGVGVYKITAPGKVEFVRAVTGFHHALQTITFDRVENTAVMLGVTSVTYDLPDDASELKYFFNPDAVYVMDILSPGVVDFAPGNLGELAHHTSTQIYGADGLTVYGRKAYSAFPIMGINSSLYPERYISVVDLTTFEVSQIAWSPAGERNPVGIAAAPYVPYRIYLPSIRSITGQQK